MTFEANVNKEYEPVEFERALVKMVCELSSEQGINFAQFARKAYGQIQGDDTAIRKWRKQRRSDDPQQVSISDAYLLAQGLGIELADLIFRTQAKLKMTR